MRNVIVKLFGSTRGVVGIAVALGVVVGLGAIALFGERDGDAVLTASGDMEIARVEVRSTAPVESAGDFAERVFYQSKTSREWGTLCRLGRDAYGSVHHVTANGVPVVGPKTAVTASNEPSDWSFLGVDPKDIDLSDVPELRQGDPVTIAGFPARDRDGEIIPGRVYVPDNTPPFLWVELTNLSDGGPPEGVVGGVSGSCVLNTARQVVGFVSANGFSFVEGTSNTWALIVPIHAAVREAKGEVDFSNATSLFNAADPAMPQINKGRYGLLNEN